MLLACCAFAGGILWARFVWIPPLWLLLASFMIGIGALALLTLRSWLAGCCSAIAVLVLLGALCCEAYLSRPSSPNLRQYANNEEVELTGTLLADATVGRGMYGSSKQSFDLAVDSVTEEGRTHQVSGGARLSLYSKSRRQEEDDDEAEESSSAPPLQYGQRVQLRAKLGVPLNYQNPGSFDYRHYLERNGIQVTGGGKFESLEILDERGGTRLGYLRARVRRAIVQRVRETWPDEQASILNAMLVGDDSSIGRDTRTDYQRSGTYHILVVSGFNVGILAFVAFWILRRFRVPDSFATVLTILLAASYAFLTDAGPPVVRAALMLAVYLVTRLLYRDRAALNAVGLTALGLLVWDPESLFDPSFQLTFLSVVAIAGIVLPILEMTSSPYRQAIQQLNVVGYDTALTPRQAQFRLDLRLVIGRLARFLGLKMAYRLVSASLGSALTFYETLLVSLVMQFALALPMAWYFHRATLSGVAANALVVPLAGILLPIAIFALAIGALSARLAALPIFAATWILNFINGTVRLFGHLRMNDVRIATPEISVALFAAFALGVALVVLRQRRTAFRLAGISALVVSSIWILSPNAKIRAAEPGKLEIVAIDVGQGDSFLMVTPEGKTLLLDAGGTLNGDHSSFDVGEDIVSPYLWSRGVDRLDAVAVSHTHFDHAGGMAAVLRNFRPRELWLPPGAPSKERTTLLNIAQSAGTELQFRFAGQQFRWNGIDVEVLNPTSDRDFGNKVEDDDSMVFRVAYGNTSALFVGDIGKSAEARIAAAHPRADLLKVGHHGSLTSTSPEFLRAISPRYAIISVGRRNSFHHPRPEVLRRLSNLPARTYRTDLFGAVRFELDGSSVRAIPLSP